MTKEEKFQKALAKMAKSCRDNKNRLIVEHFVAGLFVGQDETHIDLYSPICYKYEPQWLNRDIEIEVCHSCPSPDIYELWVCGEVNRRVHIDDIREEMLDELLAVEDFEPIITKKVYKSKPSKQKSETQKSRKDKWNDFNFVLSLIALGVSLIALIVKLC